MAKITIRNLDDSIKASLRLQAARHGWSMEEEVRQILRRMVAPVQNTGSFAQRIQQQFAQLGIDDLVIPERKIARLPPQWEDS